MDTRKHQNINQFENNTSSFRKIDVESLNIKIVDETKSIVDMSCIDIPEALFVRDVDHPNINDNYNNSEKSLIQLLDLVTENQSATINTEESRTDSFVVYLLGEIKFSEYPLLLRVKPTYKFRIHTKEITSIHDFSVERKKEIVLVEEDRHSKNTSLGKAWGEYQLAGEFVAAACNNLNNFADNYSETLYGVKVVGSKFTFYKVTIPASYVISLADGFPNQDIVIHRFPPQEDRKTLQALDYLLGQDRRTILCILAGIRSFALHF